MFFFLQLIHERLEIYHLRTEICFSTFWKDEGNCKYYFELIVSSEKKDFEIELYMLKRFPNKMLFWKSQIPETYMLKRFLDKILFGKSQIPETYMLKQVLDKTFLGNSG